MRAALFYLVLSAFLLDWFRKSMDLIVSNWIMTTDTDSTAVTLRLISKTVYDWMVVLMLAASEHSKQYLNFCCAWILVVICGDNYNNPFRGMKTMWSTSWQPRSLIVHVVTDEVNTFLNCHDWEKAADCRHRLWRWVFWHDFDCMINVVWLPSQQLWQIQKIVNCDYR